MEDPSTKACPTCQKSFSKNELSGRLWEKKRFCSKKCKSNYRSVPCTCRHCGSEFLIRARDVALGRGQFCSRHCAARYGGAQNTQQNTVALKCANCSTTFRMSASHSARKPKHHKSYCSKACEKEARTAINASCDYCGKPLHLMPSRLKRSGGKYCGGHCYHKALRTAVTRECARCGKPFSVRPSELRKSSALYCSRQCYYPDAEIVEINCYNCGRSIRKYKSRLKTHNFCSTECLYQKQEFGFGMTTEALDGGTYASFIEGLFADFLYTHGLPYETGVLLAEDRRWRCDFRVLLGGEQVWIEIDGMASSRRIPYYDEGGQPTHEKIVYMSDEGLNFIVVRQDDFTAKCQLICSLAGLEYDDSFLDRNVLRDLV